MGSTSKSLQSQWSSLPCEILSKIANSLDTRVDVLRFRAVCPSWRLSFPLPPNTPRSIKLPFHKGLSRWAFYTNCRATAFLTEYTVYALKPLGKISENETKTWVIKIQESSPGKASLKHPLYRFKDKRVGDRLPKVFNLLDYKVVEISKAYEIEVIEESETPVGIEEHKCSWDIPVAASSTFGNLDNNFVVMAVMHRYLAVWRVGDEDWTFINYDLNRLRYRSVAFHNGKFFAADYLGLTLIVDSVSLEASSVRAKRSYDVHRKYYLVKSSGYLFMVIKIDDNNIHEGVSDLLNIYKFDDERPNWVELDGLNNQALFLSEDNSFSISAKDFEGCKGNCVYSTSNSSPDFNDKHPGFDTRIFDLDGDVTILLGEFPGYSKIFWPPPTWLKKNTLAS